MTNSIPLSELESSPAASFDAYGDKYVGTIITMKHQQQTDPKTGEAKFFPSGDPMMLYVITLQPAEGEPVALWAKNGKFVAAKGTGKAMLAAIADAVKAAGGTAIEVGGKLAVAYTGESEARTGMSPAKLYTAQYEVPVAQPQSVPVDNLFSS